MKNKPLRGFEILVGETILKIDATSINIVKIQTASGKEIEIDADNTHCGVGIVGCSFAEKLDFVNGLPEPKKYPPMPKISPAKISS